MQDTKKIISRLILQKILQHEVCKFLDKTRYEELNKVFLSEDPDKELKIELRVQKTLIDRYYQPIADFSLRWFTDNLEKNDPEGNVWMDYQLKISTNISSRWNANVHEFIERAECLNALAGLLGDLHEMAGYPIQVKTLSRDERVARDLKRKYDAACDEICKHIRWQAPDLRRRLRPGGKARTFDREMISKIKVESGRYEFDINDGSDKSPKYKRYSVTIPENPAYLCSIKRVE